MQINRKRRIVLKGSLAAGALSIAAGTGLLIPRTVLASWPEAAFGAKKVPEALQALLGASDPETSADIKIKAPDIAENGAVVPIRVEVDSEALPNVSKVSVLVEMNPNPLAASFDIPPGTEVYIETRVKVAQTCTLYAVAEADGQLYMQSRETKVTLGGCGG